MLRASTLTWWHLGILTNRRYTALRERFGNLDDPLKLMSEDFLRGLKVREDAIPLTLRRLAMLDAAALEDRLSRAGIRLCSCEDDEYPVILAEVPDAPLFLSYRGDLSILEQPMLGLVGTRQMSHYGERVTARFVEPIVRAGFVTVSGLALGIDTRVAENTLSYGGLHAAVLGHGLSQISPAKNAGLADRIVGSGGLILSEFSLDQEGGKYTFPARNRIIAGLSKGTIVLEAPLGSGAIITAELALDYGRDVFAVPGPIFDPNYAGSHTLIATGQARLATSAEEVLSELGSASPPDEPVSEKAVYMPKTQAEQVVYTLLTLEPISVDDLVYSSKLPPSIVAGTLTMLELEQVVERVEGNRWVRSYA